MRKYTIDSASMYVSYLDISDQKFSFRLVCRKINWMMLSVLVQSIFLMLYEAQGTSYCKLGAKCSGNFHVAT
jgi:hypothetical protein